MARKTLVPGFRFNPTDEEIVMYFLKRKLLGKEIASDVVADVNIYDYCPSDLPDKSALKNGDLEWYFFCPKSKRYSTGSRANRATETGFWKATGKDRYVEYRGRTVATIKTLVFHLGRAKDCERTNWVVHEYRMADEQLANAGVVQDTYVLCRLFEKSGAGPKNGAQYGAPFNEDEWNDDLVNSIDSQAIVGLVDASIIRDDKQKGPATTVMTQPGSSIVTFSENEPTNMMNYKQKGPATTDMTEPGTPIVTCSANEPTNTLNDKQKGPATTNVTGPGSSIVTNEPINSLNYKLKGPATEPGSSSVMLPTNEMPANDDVICLDDFDMIMEVPEGAANAEDANAEEDDSIYGDLVNLIDLEDYNGNANKTDEAEYVLVDMVDELQGADDDLGLGKFYVDDETSKS
ncbi:putative transcription factor NAM family [Helianthus annuus]|nr:putative transcription factor NAM family [Helianthus annuus]